MALALVLVDNVLEMFSMTAVALLAQAQWQLLVALRLAGVS